jgi:hypothetical protein
MLILFLDGLYQLTCLSTMGLHYSYHFSTAATMALFHCDSVIKVLICWHCHSATVIVSLMCWFNHIYSNKILFSRRSFSAYMSGYDVIQYHHSSTEAVLIQEYLIDENIFFLGGLFPVHEKSKHEGVACSHKVDIQPLKLLSSSQIW